MEHAFIEFPSFKAMTDWMLGVDYEAGERGESVRFKVQRQGVRWYAKVV